MNGPSKVTVYSPESALSNPSKFLADMFRDLSASRELAWRLLIRDISSQYRQSILGYLWAFLPPLVSSLTFVFLNSQGLLATGDTALPYPAFALIGTLLWQVFVDAILSPLNAVTASKAMLTKINFPREAILLGGLGVVGFNFLVRLILLFGVLIWFKVPLTAGILFLPIGAAALILCGTAFGMLMVPIGGLYNDIAKAIPIFTGFWMLLTPVVYPVQGGGWAKILATYNPVSPLIVTTREFLSGQSPTLLGPFVVVSIISLILVFLAWIGFRLAMPHLIERMGG